ncbi:universal stress protein [Azospirillum doebereinerae]|nr:universal stress protein [Azospirillum doebereinerae]MCG5243883.1 universal stress protein [Azospirillum doebereinerae]
MSYRVMLVPMNGSETDAPALRMGLALAAEFNGHVDALCITPRPEDGLPVLAKGLPESTIEEMTRIARAALDARRKSARYAFDRSVLSLTGITADGQPGLAGPSASWRELHGSADTLLPREGRKSDLILLDHTTAPAQRTLIEATLLSAGRPVLLVPPSAAPAPVGRSVAIGWNGGVEAARAVGASLPFLQRADSVFVLTANPSKVDEHGSAGVERYLAWHGVAAKIVAVHPGIDDVGTALIRRAGDLGADFLVMGAYGYSRMREAVFGGVTRCMLQTPKMPLLLAH